MNTREIMFTVVEYQFHTVITLIGDGPRLYTQYNIII